ncbi:MAG: hypothetical protein JWQ42_3198 [Edaphobacter sp.]|nr:hypothetical protein [Edaphobacter sp.]
MTKTADPKSEGAARPSNVTIKRLFALSSNRCAFPRCVALLIHGKTVVGGGLDTTLGRHQQNVTATTT